MVEWAGWWWLRRRWRCVSVAAVLLVISAHSSTSASLPGSKDVSVAASSTVQQQNTSEASVVDRNAAVTKEDRERTLEGTTNADTEIILKNVTDDEAQTTGTPSNATYFTSPANVVTLAEARRRVGQHETPMEAFNPEVVENELQRLLAFFDPAQQDGRSAPRPSIGLWEYLMNYVIGTNHHPPRVELQQSYLKVEKPAQQHPCETVPGNYNLWFRKAVPLRVVVAGGGVAGLAALTSLLKLEVPDVLLLEATDRMGGRVKTVRHGEWVVEEGPSVIQGSRESPLYNIAQEEGALGPPVHDLLRDEMVVTSRGDAVPRGITELHAGVQQRLYHGLSSGELERYYGRSLGDFLSSRHQELWGPTRDLSDRAASQHIIHQVINSKFGSWTWFNVSAHDADNLELGDDHSWRGGMDGLVHALLDKVPQGQVRMLSPVCRVYWDLPGGRHALVVTADGLSYLAERVLMMLPLGVLQEHHRLMFVPPLPTSLTRGIMAVEPGSANRLNLGWAVPWWGNKPFHMVVFWKNNDFPPEMDWVSSIVEVRSTDYHSAMLEMTVTGEASHIMEKLKPETILSHLITFLRTTNKKSIVPLPLFFHRSKWCEDIWARGSYQSYAVPGKGGIHLQDRSLLVGKLLNSKKIQPVFFGGEHTSTDYFGTVDGAFGSGVAAALWAAGQLQLEKGKTSGSKSKCSKVRRVTRTDLRHTRDYFQSLPSCDDAGEDASNARLTKKERKKAKNRRKENEHSQNPSQSSLQESKSVKSPELKEYLSLKTVSNPASNTKEVTETHTSGETKDKKMTMYVDAGEKHTTERDGVFDQDLADTMDKKLVYEAHNNTRIIVPFEDIIERLLKNLSEATKDSDRSEGNIASTVRKAKQKKKRRLRRKRKQNRRQNHNSRESIRIKKTASSGNVPPQDETFNPSIPPQAITNEQRGETHLHFYLTDPKPTLKSAMSVEQITETTNNGTTDQKTIETFLPSKLTEASDTGLKVTYHNFHPSKPQVLGLNLSQSAEIPPLPFPLNSNESILTNGSTSTVSDESSSIRHTLLQLESNSEFQNTSQVFPSHTLAVPPHPIQRDDIQHRGSIKAPHKVNNRRKNIHRSRRKIKNKWRRGTLRKRRG